VRLVCEASEHSIGIVQMIPSLLQQSDTTLRCTGGAVQCPVASTLRAADWPLKQALDHEVSRPSPLQQTHKHTHTHTHTHTAAQAVSCEGLLIHNFGHTESRIFPAMDYLWELGVDRRPTLEPVTNTHTAVTVTLSVGKGRALVGVVIAWRSKLLTLQLQLHVYLHREPALE
jgi:hypothetical protein